MGAVVPLHTTPSPILSSAAVRQIVCPETELCSYVITCTRTGAAALVDPRSSVEDQLEACVAEMGVRVRYVLETHLSGPDPDATPVPAAERKRYDGLLTDLGLDDLEDTDDDLPEVTPEEPFWSSIPRVGPMPQPASARSKGLQDSLLLQAGDSSVGMRVPADQDRGSAWTIGGSHHQPLAGRICGQVRVALGAFHVQVLPLPEHRATVAYLFGACAFSGTALLAGGAVQPKQGTSPTLLTLAPDTVVYPGRLTGGLGISTIAQEVRWLRRGAHTPTSLPTGFNPLDR